MKKPKKGSGNALAYDRYPVDIRTYDPKIYMTGEELRILLRQSMAQTKRWQERHDKLVAALLRKDVKRVKKYLNYMKENAAKA